MILLGRIGTPFGVKGWVHVQSFTVPPKNLLNYKTWHLKIKNHWQSPISVLQARAHAENFVALLQGYENRDAAMQLTQVEIGVPRALLPLLAEGEYYWADLIGLTVVLQNEMHLGKVQYLLETGSNDILVVKEENREYLIPYIPGDTVLEVDLEDKLIKVRWDPEF